MSVRSVVATMIVAVALAGGTAGITAAQGQPAGVETAMIETARMAETTVVFGQVVAERESAVAARVPGIAAGIPVRVGSRVAAGDVLAQLDTELLGIELDRAETELAIAEAGVLVAQAGLDRADKAFRRAETLRAGANISDATLEDRASAMAEARGTYQQALARVAAARNAMDRAEYNLRNATVRAPFDGVVLDVATEIGQYVSAGSQVVSLLDIGRLEVQASVPARLIPALDPERPVSGQTGTGAPIELRLRAILPTEFSATHTRPVLFDLVDAESGVAVGQSVTLDLPVSEARDVVVVPKDALIQSGGGWSVFVNADGTAAPRPVEIGAAIGGAYEVLSGLAPGEEVVVRGNERLRPGQEIAPMNAADVPPDGPAQARGPAAAPADVAAEEGRLRPSGAATGAAADETAAVTDTRSGRG